MYVYVASSWRNKYQPLVVEELRRRGHEVYDFRDDGFSWKEVDPGWERWTPEQYMLGLRSPEAERGFRRDMEALERCDACLFLMPCGPSASMEAGWAKGAGRYTIAWVPEMREPDLMIKMFDVVTTEFAVVLDCLQREANRRGDAEDAARPASGREVLRSDMPDDGGAMPPPLSLRAADEEA